MKNMLILILIFVCLSVCIGQEAGSVTEETAGRADKWAAYREVARQRSEEVEANKAAESNRKAEKWAAHWEAVRQRAEEVAANRAVEASRKAEEWARIREEANRRTEEITTARAEAARLKAEEWARLREEAQRRTAEAAANRAAAAIPRTEEWIRRREEANRKAEERAVIRAEESRRNAEEWAARREEAKRRTEEAAASRAASRIEEETARKEEEARRQAERKALAEEINTQLTNRSVTGTTATAADQGVTISLSNIQFLSNSAELAADEKRKLEEIADILRTIPGRRILVTGHTALAGTEEGRLQTSFLRARAVADYLIVLKARQPGEITVHGYGAEHPRGDNSTAEGMAANRRVEITILE
ncbi:hypothetical protein AGMMS50230_12990 [Spirochaetia bacterium]|nr:hypothetical protein AGMMS50230_12990 [Spirochaetia bacterium]